MNFRNFINFLFVCVGMALGGASFSIPTPIFPSEALSRGVSVTQSGIVLGSAFLTTVLATPLCGKLIGWHGAKPVFVLGVLVCAVGNIAFGLLRYIQDPDAFFWLSLFFRILTAVGESAISPTAYPLGSQQVSDRNQGKAISVIECSFGIGMVAGPALGGFLYNLGGFAAPFWFLGVLLVLIVILTIFFFKLKPHTREEEERSTSWRSLVSAPGMKSNICGLLIAGSATNWYSAALEPYFVEKYELDAAEVGLLLMGFSIAYTVMAPIFGVIMDCGLTPIVAVLIGNLTISLSMFLLGPFPGLAFLESVPIAALALVIHGVGTAAAFLATLLGMLESTKKGGIPHTDQTTGMVTSIWLMSLCTGAFLGDITGGSVYDLAGFRWCCSIEGFVVGGLTLCLFSSALFSCHRRRHGYQRLGESNSL